MSKPDDDFFGIQYTPSTGKTDHEDRSENGTMRYEGGDFIDQQFFPGVEKYENPKYLDQNQFPTKNEVRLKKYAQGRASESTEEMDGTDYLDQQFFPGVEKYMRNDDDRNGFAIQENYRTGEEIPHGEYNIKKKSTNLSRKDILRAAREEEAQPDGLSEIRERMVPVWRMHDEEMVEFLAESLIYEDENVIALDKPYGLAYSGAGRGPRLDRILQKLKARIAPKVERLHIVRSPTKYESGVTIFAKSATAQKTMYENYASGLHTQEYSVLVRGVLPQKTVEVNVPLAKVVNAGNMKMVELKENTKSNQIHHVATELKSLRRDKYVSYLSAITKKECEHQVRAHLLSINCPIIGDKKYVRTAGTPPRLPNYTLAQLALGPNQTNKLPMFHHCRKMISESGEGPSEPILLKVDNEKDSRIVHDLCRYRKTEFLEEIAKKIGLKKRVKLYLKLHFDVRIDYEWERKVLILVKKHLEMEKLMWNLSTLGGAYSAMADYDAKFAKVAEKITKHQMKIAQELGDPSILARCWLYMALADAQQGHFQDSARVVKAVYRWAVQESGKDCLVARCAEGVWRKIEAIVKIGTVALPVN